VLPISIIAALVAISAIAAWYFLTRTYETTSVREFVKAEPQPIPTSTPAGSPATAAQPALVRSESPAPATRPPAVEIGQEYAYSGNVGKSAATFRLRFESGGRVTGTYSQNGKTFRLEGTNPTGKMVLFEFTGEQKTARLELALQDSGTEIRWEGNMFNISPNTNVYPVSFSRPR
jgi:hypothetical protein